MYNISMSNIQIRNAITKLQDVFNDVSHLLLHKDQEFVASAIEHYLNLLGVGAFDKDRSNTEWSPYNDRYGIQSIRGFTGEVLTIGLWNSQEADTQFKFGNGNQQTEVSGCDVVATNPKWNFDYVVQVKTVRSLESELIPVYDNYLKYNINDVNRFVLADIIHRKIIIVDYLSFLRCIEDNSKMINKYQFVPREDVLNTKHACMIKQ